MTRELGRFGLILKFKLIVRALLLRKKIYARFGNKKTRGKVMINMGGGLFFRPYWQVLDYISPFYPFAERYIDYNINLFENPRFPFNDNSVDFFYSAHTIEHIPQEYCPNIFKEIFRCLKPGGSVRLNMPDYERMREAVKSRDKQHFLQQLHNGLSFEESVVEQIATDMLSQVSSEQIVNDYHNMEADKFADYYTGRASRDVQKENGGFHINWFTAEKLSRLLREAGYKSVYQSVPQGSKFTEFTGEGGWLTTGDFFEMKRMLGLDTTHPDRSLYIEAVK